MGGAKNRNTIPLSVGLLLVQILDIVVHVAASEIETLRITSSVLLALVAVIGFTPIPLVFRRWTAIGAGITYVVLNGVFVAVFGLSNPATGAIRIPLFAFVAVSLLLLILSVRAQSTVSRE